MLNALKTAPGLKLGPAQYLWSHCGSKAEDKSSIIVIRRREMGREQTTEYWM
jgi:hypothetical protein